VEEEEGDCLAVFVREGLAGGEGLDAVGECEDLVGVDGCGGLVVYED
jgi:hypothetical protein